MALSPNYGWSEPDNSSLVKNGAADIRTLGDSIDTSVWNIGFGQAGKNRIINGDFGIWQRGTSFTPAVNTATYIADRFFVNRNGSGATVTVSQQSFTAGAAPVAGYEGQFFYRYAQSVAGTGATYGIYATQRVEDVRNFAGQTATFSFWAKADAGKNITVEIFQSFGSGGSGDVSVLATAQALTTSWARYTFTVAIPSVSGKTIGAGSFLSVSLLDATLNTTKTIDIWGWQLEYGSKATPFTTASETIQGELALCQRYYYRITVNAFTKICNGFNRSTTVFAAINPHPIVMRTAPTFGSSAASTFYAAVGTGGSVGSSIATGDMSPNMGEILLTTTGLTANASSQLGAQTSPAFIEFSSEL
jgi:hypothetical protein